MRKTSLILIVGVIFTLVTSCADTDSGNKSQLMATTVNTNENVTTETTELQPDIPADANFDGHNFIVLVRGETFNEWQSQDIYVVEQNGEPVNDAVYTRNVYLEEKLNIKINESQGSGDLAALAKKSIQAGSNDYDVLMVNTTESSSLATQGFLHDLNMVPYLDLEKPWWDQRSVNQLSLANKLYFMTGDLSIMANDATWILMFNKDIAENYNVESLYDAVSNETWTMDKMLQIMEDVSEDLNGDGAMKQTDDLFGFLTHTSSYEGFFFGTGSHVASKDIDDLPYLNMNNERMMGVVEKTSKLMINPIATAPLNLDPVTVMQPIFEGNRSLFYGEVMQCIIRLRAMEVDFGVLPFPKFDESQEEYNHFIHTTACMVSIPLTNMELERTGIILEAMAAKSTSTLQVAYYETCLEGKFIRDEESQDMLDIILKTRNYDIGYIYAWGGLFEAFKSSASSGNNDFASRYEKAESAAVTAMEKTLTSWIEAGE